MGRRPKRRRVTRVLERRPAREVMLAVAAAVEARASVTGAGEPENLERSW